MTGRKQPILGTGGLDMSDYISREAALEAFENTDADVMEDHGDGTSDWGFGRENIREILNSVPATDVELHSHYY